MSDHDLLKKGIPCSWNASHQKAFDTSNQQLCSETLLVHYDLAKKLILSCDASPSGVGAVLSHVMEDGSERPIGFASRTLAPAEKKYFQLDKEDLAIIFGIKKFHQHVYGRSFQITSDHKPLLGLLGENKGIASYGIGAHATMGVNTSGLRVPTSVQRREGQWKQ